MIEFVTEEDKIGFYVNTASAEAGGLKLSSQLLRVARGVRGVEGTRP
ncbi:MAG: YfiR family protein [Terriglobia bacterium]